VSATRGSGGPRAGQDGKPADSSSPEAREDRTGHQGQLPSALGRLPGWAASDPLRASAIVITLIAVVCAAWFGGSWLSAASSSSLAYSQARDGVLQAAEQGVVNLNTLNYHRARQDLELWLASSTGSLHSGLAQELQQEVQVTQQDKLITTATILDGAVTRLDASAGTASVMIALTFTVTVSNATPATKFESELGELTKTSSGWKLSSLCPTSGCNASPSASPSSGPSGTPIPGTTPTATPTPIS
jgi:Mce-associated membrane protein